MRKNILALILLATISLPLFGQITITNLQSAVQSGNTLRYDVTFTTDVSARAFVEYAYWDGTDSIYAKTGISGPATSHTITVVGLVENTTYDFWGVAFDANGCYPGSSASFTTGTAPAGIGIARIDSVWSAPGVEHEGYVLTNTLRTNPDKVMMVHNRKGELIWYEKMPGTSAGSGDRQCQHYNLSKRNTIFALECHRIIEMALDGTILTDINTAAIDPGLYLHHDAFFTLDGDVAAITSMVDTVDKTSVGGPPNEVVVGQGILVADVQGNHVWDWSIFDHYDPLTSPGPGGYWVPKFGAAAANWKHANALTQDDDGYYIISFRFEDHIVKVDPANGQPVWTLGLNGDIDMAPTDTFRGQHSIRALGDGDYLMFDNNGLDSISRVIQFWIDFDYPNPMVMIDWEYVLPQAYHSGFVSNCERLENGNTFIAAGAPGGVFEVDDQGNLLWFARQDTSMYRAFWMEDLYMRADVEYLGDTVVCLPDTAYQLTATPAGGIWSGPGVSGSVFNPTAAGIGLHTLTYKYGPQVEEFEIEVVSAGNCPVAVEPGVLAEGSLMAYPNPFTDALCLEYSLTNAGEVNIEFFSLDGRRLVSLPAATQAPGDYKVQVDPASLGLPRGNLLVRVSAGDGQSASRILVRR